jgi:hypothetical protein
MPVRVVLHGVTVIQACDTSGVALLSGVYAVVPCSSTIA